MEKDIAANKKVQEEATALRDKEHMEFQTEKTETEECIGALESATTPRPRP